MAEERGGGQTGGETATILDTGIFFFFWNHGCAKGALHVAKFSFSEDTYSANAIDLVIILWLLDHIPTDDFLVSVAIILLVCDKIGLPQKFLLMILEFAHHIIKWLWVLLFVEEENGTSKLATIWRRKL